MEDLQQMALNTSFSNSNVNGGVGSRRRSSSGGGGGGVSGSNSSTVIPPKSKLQTNYNKHNNATNAVRSSPKRLSSGGGVGVGVDVGGDDGSYSPTKMTRERKDSWDDESSWKDDTPSKPNSTTTKSTQPISAQTVPNLLLEIALFVSLLVEAWPAACDIARAN